MDSTEPLLRMSGSSMGSSSHRVDTRTTEMLLRLSGSTMASADENGDNVSMTVLEQWLKSASQGAYED